MDMSGGKLVPRHLAGWKLGKRTMQDDDPNEGGNPSPDNILLTEDGKLFITESSGQYIQVEQTVASATFGDNFSGPAANFSAPRVPDIAGDAYTLDPFGSGTLAQIAVDGTGAVPSNANNVYVRSQMGARTGTTYTLHKEFTITVPGHVADAIDVWAGDHATAAFLVEMYTSNAGPADFNWLAALYIFNVDGTQLYFDDVIFTPTGSTQVLEARVTPSGVQLWLDGVQKLTTAILSDTLPNSVTFANSSTVPGINLLEKVTLT